MGKHRWGTLCKNARSSGERRLGEQVGVHGELLMERAGTLEDVEDGVEFSGNSVLDAPHPALPLGAHAYAGDPNRTARPYD